MRSKLVSETDTDMYSIYVYEDDDEPTGLHFDVTHKNKGCRSIYVDKYSQPVVSGKKALPGNSPV